MRHIERETIRLYTEKEREELYETLSELWHMLRRVSPLAMPEVIVNGEVKIFSGHYTDAVLEAARIVRP